MENGSSMTTSYYSKMLKSIKSFCIGFLIGLAIFKEISENVMQMMKNKDK